MCHTVASKIKRIDIRWAAYLDTYRIPYTEKGELDDLLCLDFMATCNEL